MAKIIFCSGQTGNWGFVQSIKEQQIPEFEYWFLHDNHIEATDNKGWNYINIKHMYPNLSNYKKHRLLKMIQRILFDNFDITSCICVCLTYHSFNKIISTGFFPLSDTGIS